MNKKENNKRSLLAILILALILLVLSLIVSDLKTMDNIKDINFKLQIVEDGIYTLNNQFEYECIENETKSITDDGLNSCLSVCGDINYKCEEFGTEFKCRLDLGDYDKIACISNCMKNDNPSNTTITTEKCTKWQVVKYG